MAKQTSQQKLIRFILVAICLMSAATSPHVAVAFMGSEEQQFEAEIKEAIARAQAFKPTMEKMEREERERESKSEAAASARLEESQANERLRSDFVRIRNNIPSDQAERERLERDFESQQERERMTMETHRKKYVEERDRVRKLLERSAFIDEAREYGL